MTGVEPKELQDLVTLPEVFNETWEWFLRLNRKRQSSGFGVNPITYSEILSFFQLIGYSPQPWEIDMIELFDDAAMEEYSKEMKKEQKKSSSKK